MTESGRVLIVDDDPIILTVFESYFARCQIHDVLTASNGKQATAVLSFDASRVRLIILDINMPEMNGIELLRHLHSMQYCGKLIICSASHNANFESCLSLVKAYGLDLIGFIQKPLTREKLDQLLGPIVGATEVPIPA